ncbi:MAG: hypothetical protein JW709_08120 [Sedimentisphaerales bacterium]|nr:hypothetical protein [Sedimentisphaerales bacterium]
MPFQHLESEYLPAVNVTERFIREQSRDRLHLLRDEDLQLAKPYLQSDLTLMELARLTGVERRQLTRRLQRLLQGLADDRYITLRRYGDVIEPRLMAIGYERFICGDSYQTLARRHKLSVWRVRRLCRQLEAFIDERRI